MTDVARTGAGVEWKHGVPGSPEAAANGCTCSAKDNDDGRGREFSGVIGVMWWVVNLQCPQHSRPLGEHDGTDCPCWHPREEKGEDDV